MVRQGQIRPARRAIVADRLSPSSSSSSGGAKLNRRWFFGFASALNPKDPREEAPVVISQDVPRAHVAAKEAEHQRNVDKWNRAHPKAVQVKPDQMHGRSGDGRGSGTGGQ
ncbi:uncharacterized protein UTRI_00983 [Ustilago trichophora]|uniref:Uncharacterized protein n=1 Tax=Ustilago trichophora TaxID=86804 RepID=A0A5C3DVF9_9BASI|nr:uncharacterized protein UTRI_00983 [Ustilago trichophora]